MKGIIAIRNKSIIDNITNKYFDLRKRIDDLF